MPRVWTAAVKEVRGLEGIPPRLPTTSVKRRNLCVHRWEWFWLRWFHGNVCDGSNRIKRAKARFFLFRRRDVRRVWQASIPGRLCVLLGPTGLFMVNTDASLPQQRQHKLFTCLQFERVCLGVCRLFLLMICCVNNRSMTEQRLHDCSPPGNE